MGSQGHVARRWGAQLRHGGHVLETCRPLGHVTEHVACNDVGKVGAIFGPATGLFAPWIQKQSCSPPDDLQNSLRVPGH